MRAVLLIFALSLCAVAQTTSNVTGVTLTGPLANPMIENHSGKAVLLVLSRRDATDGSPRQSFKWFTDQAGGLPDGVSAELGKYKGKATITSATITAVVFGDGEFRGEDRGPLRGIAEGTFQLMREAWQLAQAGEWDKLKAKADKVEDGMRPAIAARRLLEARGNDAAMAALAHFGSLPASTWVSGPSINKLMAIPGIQAIANWSTPAIAHAQTYPCTLPTTCPPITVSTIAPYPQSSGYDYDCSDVNLLQPACRPLSGTTPFIGIKAQCTNDSSWTAVQLQIAVDYKPFDMGESAHVMNPQYYSYTFAQLPGKALV